MMDWENVPYALQFDNDKFLHEKVESKSTLNDLASVDNGDCHLAGDY